MQTRASCSACNRRVSCRSVGRVAVPSRPWQPFIFSIILFLPAGLLAGTEPDVLPGTTPIRWNEEDLSDRMMDGAHRFVEQQIHQSAKDQRRYNLYRFADRCRWLDREANSIGCMLFSFIVAQHFQIVKWLAGQPFVDGRRIAFYGLSYGGETAVRFPTILEGNCLSISTSLLMLGMARLVGGNGPERGRVIPIIGAQEDLP